MSSILIKIVRRELVAGNNGLMTIDGIEVFIFKSVYMWIYQGVER